MPNSNSLSQALQCLHTAALNAAAAADWLTGNTVDGSVARLVSGVLTAHLVVLSELEVYLHSNSSSSATRTWPETSPPGGPGGGSPPGPAHTPPRTQGDSSHGTPVYDPFPPSKADDLTPPEDWSADFDASIDALVGK